MKYPNLTASFRAVAVVTAAAQLVFAAPPPSAQVKTEVLWSALSQLADQDIASAEIQKRLDQYLRIQNDNPHSPAVHYLYAERFFRLANYESAAVGFEKFLALYPKDPMADSALYRLGESYYNAKGLNSARSAWERLVKAYPNSALAPEALRQIASLDMRAGEWGRADETLKKLRANYPFFKNENSIRELHGITKYNLSDYAEAASELEGVDQVRAAYYRGLSLFSLKLFDDSVAALTKVSSAQSGPYRESATFLKAESSFGKRDYNLASVSFVGFVSQFPQSPLVPFALLRQAACAFIVGENDRAIQLADSAIRKSSLPDVVVHAAFVKGSALLALGQFLNASKQFSIVIVRDDLPNLVAPSLVRRAWCFKKLGDAPSFERDVKTIEEKFPAYPDLQLERFLVGVSRYEQKRWEDGAERFESSLVGFRYSTLSEAALAMMSICFDNAGRSDRLVTSANSALKLVEKNYTSQSAHWRAQSYFYIGKAFYDLKRYTDAIPFFEKVTSQFGDHPLAIDAQLLCGWSLAETNANDKARAKAQALLENEKIPMSIRSDASYLKACTFFNSKDYNNAIVAFADHLKQFPSSPTEADARYLTGLSYHQKKVYGSAIEEWNRLIEKFPSNPLAQDAYLLIGDLYFKSGDFTKASATFQKFRSLWPKSPFAARAMWQELQGYFNGKADEVAIKEYPIFISQFSSDDNVPAAQKQLEMIYYRRGASGDPAKLEQFLTLYSHSPFAPAARYKLGDMAIQQKAWNRAVQEMETFIRDYPADKQVVDAEYGLGLAYESSDQVDKAVVQYNTIMKQFANKPGAVDAAFRLGSLHFKKERFAEALEAFKFASGKKMSDDLKSNVQYNIALCEESLGHLEPAAEAYAKYSTMVKTPEQRREAMMNAGLLMKKAEKHDKAAQYFASVLKDPGSQQVELQAINLLGDEYKASGKNNDAIKIYARLITVEPASSDLRLAGLAQLAYLYEQDKDLKRAVEIYEKISISEGKAEWVNAAKQRMDALVQLLNPAP